jgi:hypothetical protein
LSSGLGFSRTPARCFSRFVEGRNETTASMRLSIRETAPMPRPTPAKSGIGGPATRNVTITPSPVEDSPTAPVFFASANFSQSTTRLRRSESTAETSDLFSYRLCSGGTSLAGDMTDTNVRETRARLAFLAEPERPGTKADRHQRSWRIDPGDAGIAPVEEC